MAILTIFAFRTCAFALVLFARLYVLVLTASCLAMAFVDKVLAILSTSSLIGTANASACASWCEICPACDTLMKVKAVYDVLVTCVLEIGVSLVAYFVDCTAKRIETCCVETVMEICDVLG